MIFTGISRPLLFAQDFLDIGHDIVSPLIVGVILALLIWLTHVGRRLRIGLEYSLSLQKSENIPHMQAELTELRELFQEHVRWSTDQARRLDELDRRRRQDDRPPRLTRGDDG